MTTPAAELNYSERQFLVDWWGNKRDYELNVRVIAHAERVFSPDLATTYNRPQSVIDLQALHDNVLRLMGVK